jgi:ribosomal protein S18 acetylase RimI-like enzyme
MNLTLRYDPKPEDIENVRAIVTSTGFFHDYEIPVAVDLVRERLEHGLASEYFFVFAEDNGRTVSYACFGPIPCTKSSYDLYWIATHNDYRGRGIGTFILQEAEKEIKRLGGGAVYIETSSKEQYLPTQKFYERNHYLLEATLKDFYDINDHKLVYSKHL